MNTSFERSKQTTDEWYTPKWIVDALGSFDLDPCAPENRLWNTAKRHITPSEDAYPEIWIDNKKVSIHEVAKNDGLSVEDFVEWFFGNNKENVFEGVVIHFTGFRY